jgi:hypothetical protein
MVQPVCFPKLDEELLDKFVLPRLGNNHANQLYARDWFRGGHSSRKLSVTRKAKIITGCGKLIERSVVNALKMQRPY